MVKGTKPPLNPFRGYGILRTRADPDMRTADFHQTLSVNRAHQVASKKCYGLRQVNDRKRELFLEKRLGSWQLVG